MGSYIHSMGLYVLKWLQMGLYIQSVGLYILITATGPYLSDPPATHDYLLPVVSSNIYPALSQMLSSLIPNYTQMCYISLHKRKRCRRVEQVTVAWHCQSAQCGRKCHQLSQAKCPAIYHSFYIAMCYLWLSMGLSMHFFLSPSIYLYIKLSIYLAIYLSLSQCMNLSIYESIYLCIYP